MITFYYIISANQTGTVDDDLSKYSVRKEEIVIVGVILLLWLAVILVFINRWGRIQMPEPYLPDYKSPSDDSLALSLSMININVDSPSCTKTARRSLSDVNIGGRMFSSQMYLNRMCGVSNSRNRLNLGSNVAGSSACVLAIDSFASFRKSKSFESLN